MRYALYPGCLVLQRMQAYEASAYALLTALDVEVEFLPEWVCCGGTIVESFREDWFILPAYNLALAARLGVDLLTLCGNCTASLRRTRLLLENDNEARTLAQERLTRVGLTLEHLPETYHLLQVLDERRSQIAERIQRRLVAKVAVTYPCQVFRPVEAAAFDDPLRPQVMRRLVELTGAEVIAYEAEYDCCGSTLLSIDQALALEVGRRKLLSAQEADVIVDACGNCHLLLDRYGAAIAGGERALRKPVLFISQLLGLALGLDPEKLAIKERVVEQLLGEQLQACGDGG